MAFSSYLRFPLSRVEHPEDEEEDMRPMPRSGSVRAFSHLPEDAAPPQPQEVLRRSSSIRPFSHLSAETPMPLPSAAADLPSQADEPETDRNHDPERKSDTGLNVADDSIPWYLPRVPSTYLPQQDYNEEADESGPASGSIRPVATSWENPDHDSNIDDMSPAGRSASHPQDSGILRDSAPYPVSSNGEDPAQGRSALPGGLLFEKRPPPEGLDYRQTSRASTARVASPRSKDSPNGAAEVSPASGEDTALNDLLFEAHSSINGVTNRQGYNATLLAHRGMGRAQSAKRRRQPGGMSGGRTLSPERLCQQAAPPTPTRNKSYFVFPRNENVVVLYNKKAVENLWFQFSSGTSMGQQGLSMLQDFSGSTSNPRLIDISDPGWVRKLDALVKANKGGFTHLVILDHGNPADQHFGVFPGSYENESTLTPESTAWKIISSVMAPGGHIHFGGCRVGKDQAGRDYLNDMLRSLGKGSKITIDAVTGPMFNLSNSFEGDLIQAQPLP